MGPLAIAAVGLADVVVGALVAWIVRRGQRTGAPTGQSPDGNQWNVPASWITLILAVGLLGAFIYLAWKTATTAERPPRLADIAPSAPPTLASDGKDYVPQYRGGYDGNARLLALLAIVSPLLTTIVGFYFGQHVGAASGQVVQAQAQQRETEIARVAADAKADNKSAGELLSDLKDRGLIRG